MIKYSPKTNKSPIIALVVFLLISSIVFIIFSFFVGKVSSVTMKILGMMLLLFATAFVSKYLSCSYIYLLNENDFVITRYNAKNEKAVCRIDYYSLYEICEQSKALQKIKEEKLNVTNYCSNLFPKKSYCLFYDMGSERGVILFEPNDSFAAELKKRINVDINL